MNFNRESLLYSYHQLKFWEVYEKYNLEREVQHHTFRALKFTPLQKVKVVILGNENKHGLCYHSPPHIKRTPNATRNLLREYLRDTGYPAPRSGDLRPWTRRGVLLLPLRLGKSSKWEYLPYSIFRNRMRHKPGKIVYLLLGAGPGKFKELLSSERVILAPDPNDFTQNDGFVGSRPFTRINELLVEAGEAPIDWFLGR